MKMLLKALIAVALSATLLVGCGATNTDAPASETTETPGSQAQTTEEEPAETNQTIAFMAKGESHAFWQSVRRGAEAAGEEYGYDIIFAGPENESPETAPAQREQITAALNQEPAGIAIATIGSGYNDVFARILDMGIPMVTFDSGIKEPSELPDELVIEATVASNNSKAAALAAEEAFALIKEDIAAKSEDDKYVVGIIQHDKTVTGIDRASGFETKFMELADADTTTAGKYEIVIQESTTGKDFALLYPALGEPDFVFMTNEGVVRELKAAIDSNPGNYEGVKFFGFDAGEVQLNWMKEENSQLIGSVAQDSFQIGYLSVEELVKAINGEEATDVGLAGVFWNAENADELNESGIVYN